MGYKPTAITKQDIVIGVDSGAKKIGIVALRLHQAQKYLLLVKSNFGIRITQSDSYQITYGYVTQVNRLNLGLEKSPCNDAISISGIVRINYCVGVEFLVKQVRIKKPLC